MSEYNYEINKCIDTLREVEEELRFIATKGMEENIKMLMEGWNSSNSGKVINICGECQEELFDISKQLTTSIEELKNKKYY